MENLSEIAIWAGGGFAVFLVIAFTLTRLYRRASKEIAFVRTGVGGEKVVMNGGALVLPVFHETMPVNMNTLVLSVVRRDGEALITLDRLRIDVKAEFYVRVKPDASSIAMAAQTLGQRTMQPEMLKDLVEGKFVDDALRSVAAGMSMNELHEQRADFVQKVQQVSSNDLAMNGLELESVSLTRPSTRPASRAFQRQQRIRRRGPDQADRADRGAQETAQRHRAGHARADGNQESRSRRAQLRNRGATRNMPGLRRSVRSRSAVLRKARKSRASRPNAPARPTPRGSRRKSRSMPSRSRPTASSRRARIDQQRALEIARQEQQIAVQNKSREESQAKAEADEARAKAVAAEEQVSTSRETEIAERMKRIELIEAAKQAERDAIGVKVEAEAEKEAASNRAEALRLEAQGEAEAEKLRAEASRVRFEVEAAGQKAINEAGEYPVFGPDQPADQDGAAQGTAGGHPRERQADGSDRFDQDRPGSTDSPMAVARPLPTAARLLAADRAISRPTR